MANEAPNPQNLSPGTLLAGRYKLTKRLGAGAMGAVYEADDQGKLVALKVMYRNITDPSSTLGARFQREARVGAAIASPHVVPVYDVGFDDGLQVAYLTMGLLKGFDLAQLIRQAGPLPPSVAVRIVAQAAWGVLAAHREGVIHRDIKPANLFLHRDESGGITVKVCDFGIAKSAEQDGADLTRTGSVMGSPLFMAPEQAKNAKAVDERSDVFSLGVTLYTALAGTAPLGHLKEIPKILIALTTQEVPPIQDLAPWVPGWLASIVRGATLLDPARRCPSVRALLDALEPRTGGTLALRDTMLIGVSEEQKQVRPARATLPRAWSDLSAAAKDVHGEVPESAAAVEVDPLVGTTLGGAYTLERLLGRGGMGAVYEANDRGRKVAIKIVLESNSGTSAQESQKRFVREGRALTSIVSENVLKVLEVDTDAASGRPYLVMELLHGQDLDRLLRRVGPLEPASAARLFIQACRGLSAAHKAGIVHRDIKPANLFLAETSSGEIVCKVFDFGVAKTLESELAGTSNLTKTGGLLGSPMYMSPEQAQNAKHIDPRTDLWSLCAALYEALSGNKLWGDSLSLGELILSICTKDPLPLRGAAPWVKESLAAVVHRGLRRDPRERYASADELAAALEPFAAPSLPREALVGVPQEKRAAARQEANASTLAHLPGSSGALVSREASTVDLRPPQRPAVAPSQPGSSTTLSGATAELRALPSKSGSNTPLIIVGVLVLALLIGGGAFVMGAFGGAPPAHSVANIPTIRTPLSVSPSSAQVSVNGKAVSVVRGAVDLEGRAGDRFVIELQQDNKRQQFEVFLTSDGKASPNRVALSE